MGNTGIRVNTGVKRIEVNDDGDYITINLNDNSFLDRFFSMYENIMKMADESSAKEAAIREKYKDAAETENGSEKIQDGLLKDVFSLYKEGGKAMMAEVDGLFGPGTCKKVFGDITPSFELQLDFFDQLIPYLQEFAKEKVKRMKKYSAARTGNV